LSTLSGGMPPGLLQGLADVHSQGLVHCDVKGAKCSGMQKHAAGEALQFWLLYASGGSSEESEEEAAICRERTTGWLLK